jgi:hypothetical protein
MLCDIVVNMLWDIVVNMFWEICGGKYVVGYCGILWDTVFIPGNLGYCGRIVTE